MGVHRDLTVGTAVLCASLQENKLTAVNLYTKNESLGYLDARPRHAFRQCSVTDAAERAHKQKGRTFTEHQPDHLELISSYPAKLFLWNAVPILELAKGYKLPKKAGLYGFFNTNLNAIPVEKILYIGMSKQLDKRVTKSHHAYCHALYYGATHVAYKSIRLESWYSSEVASKPLLKIEKALIQHWSPYLNIEENVFNYTHEPLRF